ARPTKNRAEVTTGPVGLAGNYTGCTSLCPRAWHRDVAGRGVSTRDCRRRFGRGSQEAGGGRSCRGMKGGSAALVTSGQCPRAWHADLRRNDDGRPRAPVAKGHGRGELALLVQRRLDLWDLDRLARLMRLRIAVR